VTWRAGGGGTLLTHTTNRLARSGIERTNTGGLFSPTMAGMAAWPHILLLARIKVTPRVPCSPGGRICHGISAEHQTTSPFQPFTLPFRRITLCVDFATTHYRRIPTYTRDTARALPSTGMRPAMAVRRTSCFDQALAVPQTRARALARLQTGQMAANTGSGFRDKRLPLSFTQ